MPVIQTDWALCTVVVPKPKSDEIKICRDFKSVNQFRVTKHYPLPAIEDLFEYL